MNDTGLERELKLAPLGDAQATLDRLAEQTEFPPFNVERRGRETQRSLFFDTAGSHLRKAHLAFRCRTIVGRPLATWTIKGKGEVSRGIASRPEIEVQLAEDTSPALALSILAQVAAERGQPLLGSQIADVVASPSAARVAPEPYLVLAADRQIRDLRSAQPDWLLEMALDRVHLEGHPGYEHLEVEVELRRGDDAALEAARAALQAVASFRPSEGSKLSHALAHLAACECVPALRSESRQRLSQPDPQT